MKTVKSLILAAAITVLAVLSPSSFAAGSSSSGTITLIYDLPDGNILIYTTTPPTGQPAACQAYARYALDTTTTVGRGQAASIRTAFLANKIITIWGSGVCNATWGTETLLQFATSF